MEASQNPPAGKDDCSTLEAARLLGMAVRSIQMMVDRGDLQAWRTPGGHRRISRSSISSWLAKRVSKGSVAVANRQASAAPGAQTDASTGRGLRVLLIEDSAHYQNLISLLVRQHLPSAELHCADNGIAGLALAGRLEPDVLLVDILLPGIDGATLITSLRMHPQFKRSRVLVVTSLDEADRAPYAFALDGLPVVHKPRLVTDLPEPLRACVASAAERVL